MRRRERGFTLVELLTVIAIISLLMAIILPVLSKAKEQARRTACMSNLHQIATALDLYKKDYKGFPIDLMEKDSGGNLVRPIPVGERWFGPVDPASPAGQVMPAKTRSGYGIATLFPNYVSDIKVFHCPDSPVSDLADPNDVAQLDTSATPPDPAKNYVCYNSYDGFDPLFAAVTGGDLNAAVNSSAYGSFLKYCRKPWDTNNPAYKASPSLQKRMLFWKEPDADTVVTWCNLHRGDPVSGQAKEGEFDLIVYLNGSTHTVQSNPDTRQSGHLSFVQEQ